MTAPFPFSLSRVRILFVFWETCGDRLPLPEMADIPVKVTSYCVARFACLSLPFLHCSVFSLDVRADRENSKF